MRRLAIIIPSSNTTVEAEFSAALEGSQISLHIARITLKEDTIKALSAMEEKNETAVTMLKDAAIDAAVFASDSRSLVKGVGHDRIVAEKIGKILNCPVVVTSRAVVEALNEVGVHQISLATPYTDEVNRKEIEFFEKNGFEVANWKAFNLKNNLDIGRLSPNDASVLARSANSTFTDALFISSTNLCTFEVLPKLEEELQKPVISSNSATLWASLKALNSNFRPKLGRLFEVFRFHS